MANTAISGKWWITFPLGLFMILEIALGVHVLIAIWPDVAKVPDFAVQTAQAATTTTTTTSGTTTTTQVGTPAQAAAPPAAATPVATPTKLSTVNILGYHWTDPSPEGLYLVAIIVLAALGSLVHALTSFASFIGNRHFIRSWTWWYLVQPPTGIVLAIVFYFALRGGLLSVTTSTSQISPYGMGAVAALAGMFSKQAADKLQDVFDSLFRSTGDEHRKDKLVDGTDTVDVCPDTLPVGTTDLTVQIVGAGFTSGTKVQIGGVDRDTTFVDATHCNVELLPIDVVSPGVITLAVLDADATEARAHCHLRVRPRIDRVDMADGTDTMTIYGIGFTTESTVEVGSEHRAMSSQTATTIVARHEAGDTVDAVRVRNPDAAGGVSGPPG